MPSRKVTFDNGSGQQLAATLQLPVDGTPDAYALLAHCFTCSSELRSMRRLSDALTRGGFAVLRLDFTGLGESEGEFEETTFSSTVDDLVAASAFLERRYEAPRVLIGHSLGGAAALLAAMRLESVRAVSTIGAPADPQHVEKLFGEERTSIEEEGAAPVSIGGRRFNIRAEFLRDLRQSSLPAAVAGLRRPLLLLHAPRDEVVGIDNARLLFDAARHPKSFVSLDGADHLLTDPSHAEYAGELIASWARRYVNAEDHRGWKADLHDNRIMASTRSGGLRTELMANGFGLVADEPAVLGGTETGPTPYDLLAAALAACTTMTLQMYAARKGWPLEVAHVEVRHSKVHLEDSERDAAGSTPPAKIDRFERELMLIGNLSEEQRARLLEIAERCPVHRTLTEGPPEVRTRLVVVPPVVAGSA
jgi:uncharacterized OsmC-like protein/pimeloyl-ACP methyl ester carboxylesterase